MPPKLALKLPMSGSKTPSSAGSTPRSSTGGPPVKGGPLIGGAPKKMTALVGMKTKTTLPAATTKLPTSTPATVAPKAPVAKVPVPAATAEGGAAPKAPVKLVPKLKTPQGATPTGSAPPTPTAKGAKAKIPLKLPVKAPSGTTTPRSEDSSAPAALPPPKKGPGKIPLKLPVKTPSQPPSEVAEQEAAVETADDALDSSPAPEMGGTRDPTTDTPVPTPRDMPPGAHGAHDQSLASTPLPTPRDSFVPPPPSEPPSAQATPRPLHQSPPPQQPVLTTAASSSPDVAPPPPPRTVSDILGPMPSREHNPPNFDAPSPSTHQADEQAALLRGLSEGQWPSHNTQYARAAPQSEMAKELDEARVQVRQLERKLLESERYNRSQEEELRRLRETLYEREGVKVVQHMAELERENQRLRLQMQREKESTLYHQGAHLSTMDELIHLRNSVSRVGDYDKLRVEYEKLTEQVTTLIRSNTELSLRLADVSENATASNVVDLSASPLALGGSPSATAGAVLDRAERNLFGHSSKVAQLPTFVTVRRGALCSTCQRNVEIWEERLMRRTADAHAPPQPSSFSHSPSDHQQGLAVNRLNTAQDGWRELQLPNGSKVYHNSLTNQAQWQVPRALSHPSFSPGTDTVPLHGDSARYASPSHPGQRITVRPSPPPPASYSVANNGDFVYSEGSPMAARGMSLAANANTSTMVWKQ